MYRIQSVMRRMDHLRLRLAILVYGLALGTTAAIAEQIRVRHIEGVALGFLVLRSEDGKAIAYGDLKQVVDKDRVRADLKFRFKDGSSYEETTVFTQRGDFRLVSDHVSQKGPSFKQQMQSWINAETGEVTVRSFDRGKEKLVHKRLDLPADISNGLLFILVKNIRPDVPQTTVSMVAASSSPRVIKLEISPAEEKTISVGPITHKAQHYVIKFKIEGPAGVVAPLIGKQRADLHVWVVKSEAPAFIESEGPLYQDGPVWRIELTAPNSDASATK